VLRTVMAGASSASIDIGQLGNGERDVQRRGLQPGVRLCDRIPRRELDRRAGHDDPLARRGATRSR
jgi:hypothetical protein